MRPPAIRPGGCTSRMIDSAVTDLPLPDSPTRPSVSPARISKLTSSTAGAGAGRQVEDRGEVRDFKHRFDCSRRSAPGPQISRTVVSVYSPNTGRMASAISPTVALRFDRVDDAAAPDWRRSRAASRHAVERLLPGRGVAAGAHRLQRARSAAARSRDRSGTRRRAARARGVSSRNALTPTTTASPESMASCAR